MINLEDIELIKQLKYTYFKAVDTKDWSLFADCFAEDACSRYEDVTYSWQGRDNIVSSLSALIGRPTLLTQHQGHHPIIKLSSDTTSTGSWYLQDMCYELEQNWWFHGSAYYSDEYAKVDGDWKITLTGFKRVFLIRETPLPKNMKFEYDIFESAR